MASATPLDHVGRYRIIGEVGKGAMGVVYRATDPTIGRTVALKTMRVDVHGIEAEEMLQRFRNEAKAAGVMNHNNIVTIYDAGEQDGMFYIAMECIEGVTLHRLLADKRVLPAEQVIEYARQVCAGLDYAHSHGVVHRDVKPANLMIQADGTLKIMDFGIAKAGGAGMTTAGQVLGTPNYMSPEQVKGRPLDGRSDLFSFGVILYETVTGERPFTGESVTTIVYKIVHETPIPPRNLDVTIHPGLSWVITKALAKSPDERFQSGAELVKALQNYKAYGPAGEPTTGVTTRATAPEASGQSAAKVPAKAAAAKSATKKGSPAWVKYAGAALVALMLAGAGIAYLRHRINTPAEPPAEQQQAVAAPQTAPPAGEPQATQSAGPQPAAGEAASQSPATTTAEPAKSPAEKPVSSPKGRSQHVRVTSAPTLSVSSDPAGAAILVDGKETGRLTPAKIAVEKGGHKIVVRKAGFVDANVSTDIAEGETFTFAPKLQPGSSETTMGKLKSFFGGIPAGKGQVDVHSNPKGAVITVNGRPYEKKAPTKLILDPGSYTIALKLEGYKPAQKTIIVEEGKRIPLDQTLEKQ